MIASKKLVESDRNYHFFCLLCFKQYNNDLNAPMIVCSSHHGYCRSCTENNIIKKNQEHGECAQCGDRVQRGKLFQFLYLEQLKQMINYHQTNSETQNQKQMIKDDSQKFKISWLLGQLLQKQTLIRTLLNKDKADLQLNHIEYNDCNELNNGYQNLVVQAKQLEQKQNKYNYQMIDPQCFYYKDLQFQSGNIYSKQKQCIYITLKNPISKQNNKITIKLIKGCASIGIIDSSFKNQYDIYNKQNVILYNSFCGLTINQEYVHSQGFGFYQQQCITIHVDIIKGKMQWKANDYVRHRVDCKKFTDGNIKWVFCIGIHSQSYVTIINNIDNL